MQGLRKTQKLPEKVSDGKRSLSIIQVNFRYVYKKMVDYEAGGMGHSEGKLIYVAKAMFSIIGIRPVANSIR